jgi:hypothetical protein
MTKLRTVEFLVIGILGLLSGCMQQSRKLVIDSNPRGAKVYVNNMEVGTTPVDYSFLYYGTYNITLEMDGFQTETIQQRIAPPWYAYPPLDFFSEHVYPGKLTDIRRLNYDLKPVLQPNTADLLQQAQELRERGRNLPEPRNPEEGRNNSPFGRLIQPNPVPPPTVEPPRLP